MSDGRLIECVSFSTRVTDREEKRLVYGETYLFKKSPALYIGCSCSIGQDPVHSIIYRGEKTVLVHQFKDYDLRGRTIVYTERTRRSSISPQQKEYARSMLEKNLDLSVL